ncbi:MAG: fibronectin type III domain-containing protein, partial [Treponema sp.]|nr:fibronectin type III domain-containing protein [Treponema sp.]
MKKYQVLVTGICSLMLVFGVAITACKHDTGSSGGGILDTVKKGRGDGDSSVKPSAPGSIVASVASESSITITWSPVSGASGYKVHRANDSSGSYDVQGETSNSTYTDTGVSPGTPYFYKVSAYNNVGESPQSSSFASAVIIGSNGSSGSPPNAPTGVTATRLSSDEVYVTWNPVSGVTTYIVYWAEEAAGPYALEDTANTPSHTSKDWEGYDYGYFKVSAVNAAGESPLSDYARFGSYSNGSWSVPSAPSGVYASASSSSNITVSWSEVSGASGYRIYRALDIDDLFSY